MTGGRPLAGVRVAVTRARPQAADLSDRLRRLGATVIEFPVIEIVDAGDGGAALRSAVAEVAAGGYEWLVVTSTNGADRVVAALAGRTVGRTRVAAIGPATAAVLEAAGVRVELVPDRYVAEALVDCFPPGPGRVLLARAAVARDVLPDGLAAKGWDVDVVEAYRTRRAVIDRSDRQAASTTDIITFTSPSTVDGAVELLGVDHLPGAVACIGPVTADAARAHGLEVSVEAEVHTIAGLVGAVVGWARAAWTPRAN
jgi:uroporphyrinogen III methyltransferase / synthase